MSATRFVPRLSHPSRQLLVSLEYLATHRLVPGATAHLAVFIPWVELQSRSGVDLNQALQSGLSTHALTDAQFSLQFSNFEQQWRQVSAQPARWQFQGGDVFLNTDITIYVNDTYRYQSEVVEVIMEHEMLHVRDELEILTQFLPPFVQTDQQISNYLVRQQPVDGSFFQHWFRTDQFYRQLRLNWTVEHNRRKGLRDSDHAYAPYRQRIDAILQRGVSQTPPHVNNG